MGRSREPLLDVGISARCRSGRDMRIWLLLESSPATGGFPQPGQRLLHMRVEVLD